MNASRGTGRLVFSLLPLLILGSPASSLAMCCPIPCIDCDLESQGQLNLVVMDRGSGKIRLIPNIRITGVAEDFALIVPTPSEPSFQAAPGQIWSEALDLTAPVSAQRPGDSGLGCSPIFAPAQDSPTTNTRDDGVSVIRQETVGGFIATVITSDDPRALIDWLNQNNFALDPGDADKFAPYIEANWFFTTMKLDPSVETPPFWDISVDPVEISYDATELEIPLPILSINRASTFPMVFFVVDDYRADLPEFDTTYGNRISKYEFNSISASHPNLAQYVKTGDFLTRLDRRFTASEPMDKSIKLGRAQTDREYRRILGASLEGSFLEALAMLIVVLGIARIVLRRRYAAF